MARFFFNIRLDDAYLPERTGQRVEGPEAARAVARTIIRALVAQHGGEPRLLNAAIVVTDEAGDTVFALSFFEAIYVPVAPAVPVRTLGGPGRGRPAPALAARTRLAALRTQFSGLRLRLAGLRRPWQARWADGVLRLREAFGRPPFAVPGR